MKQKLCTFMCGSLKILFSALKYLVLVFSQKCFIRCQKVKVHNFKCLLLAQNRLNTSSEINPIIDAYYLYE